MQQMSAILTPNSLDRTRTVTTINQGVEASVHTEQVLICRQATTAVLQISQGGQWQNAPSNASVSAAQLDHFISFVDKYSYGIKRHREVLLNDKWQDLYQFGSRQLLHVERDGTQRFSPVDCVPCADCGIVLPRANIHIDHERPQAGNALEPVCKVFRSVGLTSASPDGIKGYTFMTHKAAKMGGVTAVNFGSRASKYTLNDVGKIYFTLAKWTLGTAVGPLKDRCLNHLINLRPLCSSCNGPTRNLRYF